MIQNSSRTEIKVYFQSQKSGNLHFKWVSEKVRKNLSAEEIIKKAKGLGSWLEPRPIGQREILILFCYTQHTMIIHFRNDSNDE